MVFIKWSLNIPFIFRTRHILWKGNDRFVMSNICEENSKYIFITYQHNFEHRNNNSKYCKSFEIIAVIFVCIQLNKFYSICNI